MIVQNWEEPSVEKSVNKQWQILATGYHIARKMDGLIPTVHTWKLKNLNFSGGKKNPKHSSDITGI